VGRERLNRKSTAGPQRARYDWTYNLGRPHTGIGLTGPVSARRLMKRINLGLALLVSVALMLAQTFGDITGEIRDLSGGVVGGAHVIVTNQATGAERIANTNQEGVYSFPSLPPGLYHLKVTVPGFEVVTRKGIELQVQQT